MPASVSSRNRAGTCNGTGWEGLPGTIPDRGRRQLEQSARQPAPGSRRTMPPISTARSTIAGLSADKSRSPAFHSGRPQLACHVPSSVAARCGSRHPGQNPVLITTEHHCSAPGRALAAYVMLPRSHRSANTSAAISDEPLTDATAIVRSSATNVGSLVKDIEATDALEPNQTTIALATVARAAHDAASMGAIRRSSNANNVDGAPAWVALTQAPPSRPHSQSGSGEKPARIAPLQSASLSLVHRESPSPGRQSESVRWRKKRVP
jgi:hypothetical protein